MSSPRYASSKILNSVFVVIFSLHPVGLSAQPSGHPGIGKLAPREKAGLLLLQKQYDRAVKEYKKLLEHGEDDANVVRGLVQSYQGAGRLEEAEDYLKKRLGSSRRRSSLLYGLGYIYYLTRRINQAESFFAEAVQGDPANALAWNNWGAVLADKKLYSEGIEKVKKAIGINPSEIIFFNNLWRIYDKMKARNLILAEFENHVRDGQSVLAKGYGLALARKIRQEGFSLYAKGDLGKAVESFLNLAEIYRKIDHVSGLVPALFSLGLLYDEQGEPEKAEKYFQEVLAINPGHIQAREKVKK
jgi:tetratricopeptide (TPR) repeat protein